MRILLVRLRSLGDAVLATPVMAAARAAGHEVTVVLERPWADLFQNHPWTDRVLSLRAGRLWDRWRLVAEIRGQGFDLAIDLHGGSTSGLITVLSGADRTVGFAGSRLARRFGVQVPDPREVWGRSPIHTVEYQLAALKYLGIAVEPIPSPHLPVDPGESESVALLLREHGVDEGFVLIHPAAAFATKQWPADRFARLASELAGRGHRVLVTAGPGQERLVSSVVDFARDQGAGRGHVQPLPTLSLRRFTALAARCSLYVGNDTGTTHMAAAVGRPVVVVFGSSNPRAWHPWGVPYRLVGSSRACIPCPGYHCLHYREPRCIRDVTVDEVLAATQSLAQRTPQSAFGPPKPPESDFG